MRILALIKDYSLRIEDNILFTKTNTPVAIVLEDRDLILLNGDDGGYLGWIDDYLDLYEKQITVSFRCLGRFFTDGKTPTDTEMIDALNCVVIKDFTSDSIIRQKKSPGAGYVHTYGDEWHRSASVLFENQLTGLYILMGVDDDQYFGCSFAMEEAIAQSISEAYKALMPEHIRDTLPEYISRQGEWFFVKLDGKPEDYDGAEKIHFNNDHIEQQYVLKSRNDSPVSNTHVVECRELWLINDSYGINNGNKIPIFKNPTVYHNQHPELSMEGFCWPVENTAIKSYSEEGVD